MVARLAFCLVLLAGAAQAQQQRQPSRERLCEEAQELVAAADLLERRGDAATATLLRAAGLSEMERYCTPPPAAPRRNPPR